MIKGIIFDADGTLLDSMGIWHELGGKYLKVEGIEPEDGLADILYPMTLAESAEYLRGKYRLDKSAEKITAELIAMIEDFYKNEVSAKRGAVAFIKKCGECGIKMSIATAGDKALLCAALERLMIRDYFSEILTCAETGTSKHEPDIYLKLAEKMGTAPSETAVFEDVLYAISAAKRAGFVTYAAEDEFSAKERTEIMEKADYYIKDFCGLSAEEDLI